MNSTESLQCWLNEIQSEIVFWDKLFATQGQTGGNPEIFKFRISQDCPFQIPEDLEGERCRILDVGSGPYSRLGYKLNGEKMDLTLIDPLAYVYRELEKKYGYKFAVSPRTGMVECLCLTLKEDDYDLVHMSNSLDHSFDPIEGIRQLLFVTRVGGKVILRHHNNVAEQENYEGLHQWNLTVENNRFVIWNKREGRIDVQEIIKDFATIEFAAPSEETTLGSKWRFNKIIIRKTKDFELVPAYAGDVLVQMCEHIMQVDMEEASRRKMNKMQRVMAELRKK